MGYNYWYGIDYTYIIFVLPALIISLWAQMRVTTAFSKYEKIISSSGLSGADIAYRILSLNNIHDVKIERVRGRLTDHFDPSAKILRLSEPVFVSSSIAAVCVAAHECGHAIQHAKGYTPLTLRTKIYPVVSISSSISVPLIIIGLIANTPYLITAGIIFFSAVVVFQLVTLPVEFNASKRALTILENTQLLSSSELSGAKKVLFAAALTYVASALTSLMQLIRLIVISNNRRD